MNNSCADSRAQFASIAVNVPEVLLPVAGVDPKAWAVVACDQYSSEKEYWEQVAAFVGDKPSTLNLIFPECYLEDEDKEDRIASIHSAMAKYMQSGILGSRGSGFILVERRTPYEPKPRIGLVMAVDLEEYRYGKDSDSLIRPTEGTIVERLPPRMQIRRGAPLELPHIMLLIDDAARSVIEPVYARRTQLSKVYDVDLQAASGHVAGWFVPEGPDTAAIAQALTVVADPAAFKQKYGTDKVLLFAVGDGNHSLATAKATWEELKKSAASSDAAANRESAASTPNVAARIPAALANHPARYALVELINIYDEGLPFHPIHRVLFGVDAAALLADLAQHAARIERLPSAASARARCDASGAVDASGGPGVHSVAFMYEGGAGLIHFDKPTANLAAGSIQNFLDSWLSGHKNVVIDYIHGAESLETLACKPGNFGFYLPPVDKASFFSTVIRDGVMPRKTFSMGEAPEKRFYMEARRIL